MFKRKQAAPPPAGTEWSRLEEVRREWPQSGFDPEADLQAWEQGVELYNARDDYASMVHAAGLMCRALRYELYGSGLLTGSDLPTTTHQVLFGSAFPPPDRQSFPATVAAQLRLALTIVKKHGWQAVEHGGTGQMADFIGASHIVMTMAVAPSQERPWEGNLRDFFTRNPFEIPDMPAASAPPSRSAGSENPSDAVESVYRTVQQAEAGDPAADARMKGLAAAMRDDHPAALHAFESAAQMGDVDSMYDAGQAAHDLGLKPQCLYWFETAAAAGHAGAAYNLGVIARTDGDVAGARRWWEQAATLGDASGYAALTQLACDTGDDAAEARFARLGADAGQPFCQLRHGQLLMRTHPQDASVLHSDVIPLLTRASDAGQEGAEFLIGIAYGQLGEMSKAGLWLKRAEANGDADATRVLREHGLN